MAKANTNKLTPEQMESLENLFGGILVEPGLSAELKRDFAEQLNLFDQGKPSKIDPKPQPKSKHAWTEDEIRSKITTDPSWTIRALLAIYNNQTDDEQFAGTTKYKNNIGFNGVDAEILTSFVKFYQERGFLSAKQIAIAQKKIGKYAKQLLSIIQ